MFTPHAIGFVSSPYKTTESIPKGLGAKHEAVGTLKILLEFEPGLADIEGFSHLFVIWEFGRSQGVEFIGLTAERQPPARSLRNSVGIAIASHIRL